MSDIYAAAYPIYRDRCWSPIKLHAGTKWPPPVGFTGHDGVHPSGADMYAWAEEEPDGNLAVRLGECFAGIDCDDYDGKRGGATIAEAEDRWGALPYSPRSSSRADDPISGIKFYRIPAGTKLVTCLGFPELGLGGVEIIQFHHRYAVCWPSVHDKTGQTYRWYGIDGAVLDGPPTAYDVPDLPPRWLEGMREPDPVEAVLGDERADIEACLTGGGPSPKVAERLTAAMASCRGSSRHDDTRDHVLALLRYGRQTEPGVKIALVTLGQAFIAAVTPDRLGGAAEASYEYRKFVYSERVAAMLAYDDTDWIRRLAERHAATNGQAPAPADEAEPTDPNETAIRQWMTNLRVRREGQRRLDAEERPPIIAPPVRDLTALLAEPNSPTRYRIDAVAPQDARIILSAAYKAGKTTLVGNLIRALVDGDPFLGAFAVNTRAQRLVLIDDEMSENTLRLWLREQNIRNTDAVVDVISLRGRVGAFDLLDDRRRNEWVSRLRDLGCDYLILDCLRPVLDALGLDENHDAGRFLVNFDALLADVGIDDATLVQHMGHSSERARGDSRLQDWPDAIWRLVRDDDDPSSRYFTALGRDVAVPECRLGFDPLTRRLVVAGGSRENAKTEAAWCAVVRLLAEHSDGLSKDAIETQLAGDGHPRAAVRAALKRGVEGSVLRKQQKGAQRAQMHSIAYPCSACRLPVTSRRERHESCPPEPEGMPL